MKNISEVQKMLLRIEYETINNIQALRELDGPEISAVIKILELLRHQLMTMRKKAARKNKWDKQSHY